MNALLTKWMREALDKQHLDYILAPPAMQSDLRKARKQIDRPPDWHKDVKTWHAGLALGPYWLPELRHRSAAWEKSFKVVVAPGAWDDDDNDSNDDYDWDTGTWRRHWKSTWWTGGWNHRGGGGNWRW